MSVYALRLENGVDTAARARMADLLGLNQASNLGARGGVRPGPTAGDVAVVNGTMTVTVQPFLAFIDGGVSDAQGGYPFVCDAAVTLTLDAGHASLVRTDTVVAVVKDNPFDSSGAVSATVEVVKGTPGAGAPTLPTNSVALRDIAVPAGASAGTGGMSSGALAADRRTYLSALGGVIPVKSQAERDALPAVKGLLVYRLDTDTFEQRRGTTWEPVGGAQGRLGSVLRPVVVGIDSEVEVTSLAVTVAASRRVKLTLTTQIDPVAAGSGIMFRIKRAGTLVAEFPHVGAATFADARTFVAEDTPAAGPVTYTLHTAAHGATPQQMDYAVLLVEDIGRA